MHTDLVSPYLEAIRSEKAHAEIKAGTILLEATDTFVKYLIPVRGGYLGIIRPSDAVMATKVIPILHKRQQ